MEKSGGIVTALSWVKNMVFSKTTHRKRSKEVALEGILHHIDGKVTKKMDELVTILKSDEVEFIGFIPSVSYIKENSSSKDELQAMFVHPFSSPTLLYKMRDIPVLLIANGNLDFNDSVLCKISENKYNEDIQKIAQAILGITG
jgi:hypothetical protein